MKHKLILLFSLLCSAQLFAKEAVRQTVIIEYIEKYADIAVANMQKHNIPASITLAQGILESGAGQSELAKKSNNHFGIKCHNDWQGDRVYHDDDEKQECFRKYKSPELSFEDHSQFLKKDRYKKLFSYEKTDYKSWAKGLKECGYATASDYAKRLIDLIETYELYQYDTDQKKVVVPDDQLREEDTPDQNNSVIAENPSQKRSSMGKIPAYRTHKVSSSGIYKVVKANIGDTYESIAKEFDLQPWQIRKYNQVKKRSGKQPETGESVIIGKNK